MPVPLDFEAHPEKVESFLRELAARCAHRVGTRSANTEEFTECVMLDMYIPQHWRAWRSKGFSRSWAAKCAANLLIDFLGKNAELARTEVSAETCKTQYEACPSASRELTVGIMQDESRRELETAIDTLTSGQQLALRLRFFEGLTLQDTADILAITPDAVRMLISRALTRLRKRLLLTGFDVDEVLAIWGPAPPPFSERTIAPQPTIFKKSISVYKNTRSVLAADPVIYSMGKSIAGVH